MKWGDFLTKTQKLLRNRIFLYLLLTSLVLVTMFPLLIAVSTSLKSMNDIRSNPGRLIPEVIHFDNYKAAFSRGNWPQYFRNSFFITVVTTGISLITNSLAGYAFARLKFKGRNFLFGFSLFGMMVPMQVIMIPMFLRIKSLPLMGGNNILGIGGSGLLNNIWGIIIPMLAGPFGVFLCRQFFLGFPMALDEAAKMDGSSSLKTYLRIYLPLSKPVLATLGILKATDAWNQYLWPLIITNSESGRTVQLALAMFRGSNIVEWNLLMAATIVICIPILILFLFLQKYYVQGVITSGVKG